MSGLKNSPFGKRLRASHQDTDDEAPKRNRPRINPIFGVASANSSTPSLDYSSRPTTSDSSGGPESPVDHPRVARDYGDRFVPSRDAGDMRTSYHLMDEGGPSTPSKHRLIPSESDALKGEGFSLISIYTLLPVLGTSQMFFGRAEHAASAPSASLSLLSLC
jgi:cell division cycle 20-like protein 1, cofactor of APC complex